MGSGSSLGPAAQEVISRSPCSLFAASREIPARQEGSQRWGRKLGQDHPQPPRALLSSSGHQDRYLLTNKSPHLLHIPSSPMFCAGCPECQSIDPHISRPPGTPLACVSSTCPPGSQVALSHTQSVLPGSPRLLFCPCPQFTCVDTLGCVDVRYLGSEESLIAFSAVLPLPGGGFLQMSARADLCSKPASH